MKSIIVLIINGKNFFFEEGDLTLNDKKNLNIIAKDKRIFSEEFINNNEEEKICTVYIKEVKSRFNIDLKRINITEILRI